MSCCAQKTPSCCKSSTKLKQHLNSVVPMKNPLPQLDAEKNNCCTVKKSCCDTKNTTCQEIIEKTEQLDLENLEGISEEDIEQVMNQSGATRIKAIQALKNNDNDVVNAIVELL